VLVVYTYVYIIYCCVCFVCVAVVRIRSECSVNIVELGGVAVRSKTERTLKRRFLV
jgi:hypothetical protein